MSGPPWMLVRPDGPRTSLKEARARGTVRRIVRSFAPYRRQVGLVSVVVLFSAGLGVLSPLLIKVVFDRALFCAACPDLPLLYGLVAAMVAVPVASGAIGVWQTYLTNVIGQRVMQDLRNDLYAHLQGMPLRFFTSTRTGEIQSRLSNDVGGVQSVVTDTAASVLANVVILASTLVAMLVLSWELTVLSVAMLPFFAWLTKRVGGVRRELSSSTAKTQAELTALSEETLSVSGVLLSKAFGRQRDEIARYRDGNRRLAALQIRQQMVGRSFFALVQVFFSITPALVYLVAGQVNAGGTRPLSAGTIVAFTTLQSRLFFPIGQLLEVSVQVQSSLALFDRIYEYLDLPQEIVDAPDAVDLAPADVRGHVAFRDVSFRYAEGAVDAPTPEARGEAERPWSLRHASLEILPGQLAAVVGASGSGKTTMSYLLPRLYDVTEGTVEIDGVDVRRIRLESLGQIIGMVTQETYLFHATIGENLRYGRPDASDGELEAAARAAAIWDRIAELPDGLDTVVGERGYRMSGGEKQRLAIARVILKDPRILVLDEATSALDTVNERLVQAALTPLMAGRTTVAIAHRLSTILAADVIFVLDRGQVVERGTHAELLARGGAYARLYAEQFGGGRLEARCADGVVLRSGEVVHEPTPS